MSGATHARTKLVHSCYQSVSSYHVFMKTCEVPDCARPYYGRGYCNMHYQRWRAHGDSAVKMNMRNEPVAERFWSKVTIGKADECWPFSPASPKHGYGTFTLSGRRQMAHRVSFYLAHGRWPEPHCLHSCDNPPCVNPAHLSEGTHAENMQQMIERGRKATLEGQAHPQARLTEENVREAQQLRDEGWKLSDLATRYGVSLPTIGRILQGRGWRSATAGYKPAIKRAGEPKRGAAHPMAKATPELVADIRRRSDGGESRASLQRHFGLSKSTIQRIVTRTGWRDDE